MSLSLIFAQAWKIWAIQKKIVLSSKRAINGRRYSDSRNFHSLRVSRFIPWGQEYFLYTIIPSFNPTLFLTLTTQPNFFRMWVHKSLVVYIFTEYHKFTTAFIPSKLHFHYHKFYSSHVLKFWFHNQVIRWQNPSHKPLLLFLFALCMLNTTGLCYYPVLQFIFCFTELSGMEIPPILFYRGTQKLKFMLSTRHTFSIASFHKSSHTVFYRKSLRSLIQHDANTSIHIKSVPRNVRKNFPWKKKNIYIPEKLGLYRAL